MVMNKLQQASLRVNDRKCEYRKMSMRFLGHVISAEGVLPDPQKTAFIKAAMPPGDEKEVRSFLGLAGYYAQFVDHFAERVEPLRRLLRAGTEFNWSSECQAAFEEVQRMISSADFLKIFDSRLEVVLACDASATGLGAVLYMIAPKGTEQRVAYASRTLTPTERRYSVIEREALAGAWAMQHFKSYLWGVRFTLITDHKPLVSILNGRNYENLSLRLCRLATKMLAYEFSCVYRAGEMNTVADYLSRVRRPCTDQAADTTCFLEEIMPLTTLHVALQSSSISPESWRHHCATCAELKSIKVNLNDNSDDGGGAAKYREVKSELQVVGEEVFRGKEKRVPPISLRSSLIQMAHQGHQGMVRSKNLLRRHFWWPGMDRELEDYLRSCPECLCSEKSHQFRSPPISATPLPEGPWQKLSIDIAGPLAPNEQVGGFRFAVSVVDYYSKWPEVWFTNSTAAADIIGFLQQLFAREGLPCALVSDNGPQFRSREFEEFLTRHNIVHITTAVYHPQANGLVERFNGVIKQQLHFIHSPDWRSRWNSFLLAYRATPHPGTGKSPFLLMRGREAVLPLSSFLPPIVAPSRKNILHHYTSYKEKMIMRENNKHRTRPSFKPGEMVRVKHPTATQPMMKKVSRKCGKFYYELDDGSKWHASRLAHHHMENFADITTEAAEGEEPVDQNPEPARRYPTRERHPPSRFK
jgi:hypothetical protein